MKKRFLILLISMAVVLVGCGNSTMANVDDSPNVDVEDEKSDNEIDDVVDNVAPQIEEVTGYISEIESTTDSSGQNVSNVKLVDDVGNPCGEVVVSKAVADSLVVGSKITAEADESMNAVSFNVTDKFISESTEANGGMRITFYEQTNGLWMAKVERFDGNSDSYIVRDLSPNTGYTYYNPNIAFEANDGFWFASNGGYDLAICFEKPFDPRNMSDQDLVDFLGNGAVDTPVWSNREEDSGIYKVKISVKSVYQGKFNGYYLLYYIKDYNTGDGYLYLSEERQSQDTGDVTQRCIDVIDSVTRI